MSILELYKYAPAATQAPSSQFNSNLDYVKELEKENQLLMKNNTLLQKQTANNTTQIGHLDDIVAKLLSQHANVSSTHPLPSAKDLASDLQTAAKPVPQTVPQTETFDQWNARMNKKAAPVQVPVVHKPISQPVRRP